ncbi:hypothetical protein HYE67_003108 [Fusarium culmorum]|uniref:Uncharacterized protein n=1 Tax=Fusarium culmorum TaxID=5516 RepID=A0A7S8D2N3_FUSCU|nr:hypothetical protein HYE67_003108 [Fusarium culmorum]
MSQRVTSKSNKSLHPATTVVILVPGINAERPVRWTGNNGAAFIRKALDGVGEGHGRQLFYEYHTDVVMHDEHFYDQVAESI